MGRKPQVDYRKFPFRNIYDPKFAHLKLLLSWVIYFAFYILTEAYIPYDRCRVIYSPLDDIVPFCEYFVVPYVLWYALVAGSLLYFLLFDVKSFQSLQKYIIITQIIAMTVYILFPNRQDLRPQSFPRDNIFTQVVSLLYSIDTSTNVCPSMHVAFSVAIASVWVKKHVKWPIKTAIVLFAVTVCFSTVLIKQHSVVDGFAALVVCLLAEWRVFYKGGGQQKW